jgi:hypothetical protein
MKKWVLFLAIALVFVLQTIFSPQIQFFTLHNHNQRKMIAHLQDRFEVLYGAPDEQLGFRRKALFRIHIYENMECYVVFLRDKQNQEDYIHLYDASSFDLLSSFPLKPFNISRNEEFLYREVIDLNQDGNIEIVAVVQSSAGKTLQIFSIREKKIVEVPIVMATNYALIYLEDLNHDGKLEIVAQSRLNGLLQAPEIFHFGKEQLENSALGDFPKLVQRYERYLKTTKELLPGQNELFEAQLIDIQLSRLYLYLTLANKEAFNDLFQSLKNDLQWEIDPGKRLRYYRSMIYEAWWKLEDQEMEEAESLIMQAIQELQSSITYRTEAELQSLVYVEIANYYRWKRDLYFSRLFLEKALQLNPYNMIAKGFLESYFFEYASN